MTTSRRTFLRRSAAIGGAAVLAPSLAGLISRVDGQDVPAVRWADLGAGGYGPLRPAGPELALPEGFRYWVLSEIGQPMSDGSPTPNAFDGMAAFPLPNGDVRLIRNHENRDRPGEATLIGNPELAYDRLAGGGTVTLDVRIDSDGVPHLVRDFVSLSGTIINCAGGPTPWGSWLSCEESVAGTRHGWQREHGYVFEVPASTEAEVPAVPIPAMGRFVHEAVAVDPRTGIVFLTEDAGRSGFYRYLPRTPGRLLDGGRLEMLALRDHPQHDTATGQRVGTTRPVRWVPIEHVNPASGEQAVFDQGFAQGGARFARLEGCWPGDGGIFFHSTSGGDAEVGQVWFHRPGRLDGGDLTLVFESPSRDVLDYPDNITVSPRGGIVICEDGQGEQHLRGLTPDGRLFDFAGNLMNTSEFCGACFAPDGETLFVNVQGSTTRGGTVRGVTLAIRGPWGTGAL